MNFFNSLDHTVGAKVVGEDKTVSGKVNESAAAVIAKTREVDQNRGVSAKFNDYYSKAMGTSMGQKSVSFTARLDSADHLGTVTGFRSFTRLRRSKCLMSTRRLGGLR